MIIIKRHIQTFVLHTTQISIRSRTSDTGFNWNGLALQKDILTILPKVVNSEIQIFE